MKVKAPEMRLVEFSVCSWQNNKKIGPILAINNKDFEYQDVAEKFN